VPIIRVDTEKIGLGGANSLSSIFRLDRIRKLFLRDDLQFAADGIGRKAGPQQSPVEGGNFLLIEGSAKQFEFALDALADGVALNFVVGGLADGCFDVAVGNAAGTKIARNAEFSLPPNFNALPRELFGVARVVEQAVFLQTRYNDLGQEFTGCTALKQFLHLVHRVRPPRQRTQRNIVEFGFRVESLSAREHDNKDRRKSAPSRQWKVESNGADAPFEAQDETDVVGAEGKGETRRAGLQTRLRGDRNTEGTDQEVGEESQTPSVLSATSVLRPL
jgi:hypothetical protein